MSCPTPRKHHPDRATAFLHNLNHHTGKLDVVMCEECGDWYLRKNEPRRVIGGESSCFSKKAYPDMHMAQDVATQRMGNEGRAYFCRLCERWHITKKR